MMSIFIHVSWCAWHQKVPYKPIFFAVLLKNKIQLSKCKGLLGFIKQFMNWVAFHLATRRVL